jgi:hypothetical protein
MGRLIGLKKSKDLFFPPIFMVTFLFKYVEAFKG